MLPVRTSAVDAKPRPPLVTLQNAIDPLPQLLLSFPMPQLIVPTCVSADGAVQHLYRGASAAVSETEETMAEDVAREAVKGFSELIGCGRYSQFLHEALAAEEGSVSCDSASGQSEGATESSEAARAPTVATVVDQKMERDLRAAVTSRGPPRGPVNRGASCPPMADGPADSWSHALPKMALRPRCPVPPSADVAPPASETRESCRVRRSRGAGSVTSSHELSPLEDQKSQVITQTSLVKELIAAPPRTILSFERMLQAVSALSLDVHAFDGVEPQAVREALVYWANEGQQLMNDGEVRSSEAHHDPKTSPCRAVMQGLLCCSCLSHRSFLTEWVSEGLVSNLITLLAFTIRGTGHALAAAESTHAATGGPDALLWWCTQLRQYLRCFTVMTCHQTLQVISDTDLVRLEELVTQCMLTIPQRSRTKGCLMQYAAYVMESAVFLYRCVWNRLSLQRGVCGASFFTRLVTTDLMAVRCHTLEDGGAKVMPLTVAVLAAAQSVPIDSESISGLHVVRFQKQFAQWASLILQHLLLNPLSQSHEATESADQAGTIVVQLFEDLAEMLGMLEWPGADPLLRTCVVALTRLCFSSESTKLSTDYPTGSVTPKCRSIAVDALAHVAYKLVDPENIVARMLLMATEDQGSEQDGLQRILPETTLCAEDWLGRITQQKDPKQDCDSQEAGLSAMEQLEGCLYAALSDRHQQHQSALDMASEWYHLRAAHLFLWSSFHEHARHSISEANQIPRLPESVLEELVRRPATGVPSDRPVAMGDPLRMWSIAIGSRMDLSMLGPRLRHMTVSCLVSLFHQKDADGAEIAIPDQLAKRVLLHLTRLIRLSPALHRVVWPICRQCVRDDSARVREAIIPILLALLDTALPTAASSIGVLPDMVDTAMDIFSTLLHLLEDRSVAVVSRAISALEALLTESRHDQFLHATPRTGGIIRFAQNKLLAFASPEADQRLQTEVARLFTQRWAVTLYEDATVSAGTQTATELISLIQMEGMEFPFDMADNNRVQQLLHQVYQLNHPQDRTTANARRRVGKGIVEVEQLHHAFRATSRALWDRFQANSSVEEAAASLAALHAFALVCPAWVDPLVEVVQQALVFPPPADSPLHDAPVELVGCSMFHMCRVVHAMLTSAHLATLSLERLSKSLTILLSKYVGPYQQRVIVACCGALTALITCGTAHQPMQHINRPYLLLCYSLMNSYYIQLKALLPRLAAAEHRDPQNVAYALRFLFLLSEFVRRYPGWRQLKLQSYLPLTADERGRNLEQGVGVCENLFQTVEELLRSCHRDDRGRLFQVSLRLLSSLSMVDPTNYLYRCEEHLQEALSESGDVSVQQQGLNFIRDFLEDEDLRVNRAAQQDAEGNTRLKEATVEAVAPPQKRGKRSRSTRESAKPRPSPTMPGSEDQNSGLCTWIMQKFHASIVALSISQHSSVRTTCMNVLHMAAQGGLLPPIKYLDVLVALSTDPDEQLRSSAQQCLSSLGTQHEAALQSQVFTGILCAYRLHHACGKNLIESAVLASGDKCSVYAGVLANLRKHGRETLLSSLVRIFYQESRGRPTIEGPQPARTSPLQRKSVTTFLGHLAAGISFLPWTQESTVQHVLHQCRVGLDLHGQSMLDAFDDYTLMKVQKLLSSGSESAVVANFGVFVWRCTGTVLLFYISRFLQRSMRTQAAKARRSNNRGNVPANTPFTLALGKDVAAAECFTTALSTFVVKTASITELLERLDAEDEDSWSSLPVPTEPLMAGLTFMKEELTTALAEEESQPVERLKATAKDKQRGRPSTGSVASTHKRRSQVIQSDSSSCSTRATSLSTISDSSVSVDSSSDDTELE